jgi:hypothetical protein
MEREVAAGGGIDVAVAHLCTVAIDGSHLGATTAVRPTSAQMLSRRYDDGYEYKYNHSTAMDGSDSVSGLGTLPISSSFEITSNSCALRARMIDRN